MGDSSRIAAMMHRNRLLSALSDSVREHIAPDLQSIDLPVGAIVGEPRAALDYAYFPTSAIVSLQCLLADGSAAQIAAVGNDGVVGVGLLLSGGATSSRAVVIVAGQAYRLRARALVETFSRCAEMQYLLLRYTQALMAQVSQTAVCNRHHSIDKQLCRWLLLTLDRQPLADITITHELIAHILGVRREGISAVAGKLEDAGLIQRRRGHITVVDRAGLEARCCECYGVVAREAERLGSRPDQLAGTPPRFDESSEGRFHDLNRLALQGA
jgi:CRP-like cAMP-binding protein